MNDVRLVAGRPKMLVTRNYNGVPTPTGGPPLTIQIGDIIEVIRAELHNPWWQVRLRLQQVLPLLLFYHKLESAGIKPHREKKQTEQLEEQHVLNDEIILSS